jgi:hypothetical protein
MKPGIETSYCSEGRHSVTDVTTGLCEIWQLTYITRDLHPNVLKGFNLYFHQVRQNIWRNTASGQQLENIEQSATF